MTNIIINLKRNRTTYIGCNQNIQITEPTVEHFKGVICNLMFFPNAAFVICVLWDEDYTVLLVVYLHNHQAAPDKFCALFMHYYLKQQDLRSTGA